MSYHRVIPRDLFNEANLLKCMGQLWLELDRRGLSDYLGHHAPDEPFRVKQCSDDGSLSVQNVILVVNGRQVQLIRPLNSRSSWPLWARLDDHDYSVFNSDGTLTDEFLTSILHLPASAA